MGNKDSQENYEAGITGIFLELFNLEYGTDYQAGPAENQESIIDRRGVSRSGRYSDLKIQLKEVRKWDKNFVIELRDELPARSHKDVKAFDSNIFSYLGTQIESACKQYKNSPEISNVTLVLEIGVTKDWLIDWVAEYCTKIQEYPFMGVYCLSKASNLNKAYIYPIKIHNLQI